MADSNSSPRGPSPGSIACDPTNYDWNELDQDGSSARYFDIKTVETAIATSIESAPGLANVANGPSRAYDTTNIWRDPAFANLDPRSRPSNLSASTFPSNANGNSSYVATQLANRQRTTDKEVVDFMHGESLIETMMRLCNQFVPIVEDNADTLIHIGTPPQPAGQSDYEYAYIRRQFQRPYLMRSDTLRKLDSTKFNDLLGPRSARTQRRLQKAGIHKLIVQPEKIKYFIDLTPNIHDDEGMILLTELSAPRGARTWHQKAKRWGIISSHVCGRDTFDLPPKPIYRSQSQEDSEPNLQSKREEDEAELVNKEKVFANGSIVSDEEQQQIDRKKEEKPSEYDLPEEDDYSQLRHYTAIARLLHAISGQDPKLNSTPKVWTFCMLAKFFDCAKNSLINRWITDWLVQSNNLNFIQTNPATAYRLGMAIESIWLVKTSFSIMVGQKAFASTAADVKEPTAFPFVPASLITSDLDDDEINRVDHAALVLVQRVKDSLNQLLRDNGEWLIYRKPNSELSKFYQLEFKHPKAQSALEQAKTCLNRYIQRILCTAFIEVDYTKENPKDFPQKSSMDSIARYNDIPSLSRPLTLQFWEGLQKEDFSVDYADNTYLGNHKYWTHTLEALLRDGVIDAELATIPYVSKVELTQAVDWLNTLPFYLHLEDQQSSPNKKVKLSPKQEKTYSPPSARNDIPTHSESPLSEKPIMKPTEPFTQYARDTQVQRKYSWESDSDWEKAADHKNETVHGSESDDREKALEDLESQTDSKIVLPSVPTRDLPVRNKPYASQMSAFQASIQEHAKTVSSHWKKFSSPEQDDYQTYLDRIHQHTQRQDPPVTYLQHRNQYGNPGSSHPGNSFEVFSVNDSTTNRVPPKSSRECTTCSIRHVKCPDGACPDCGQCTRRGHFCDYRFDPFRDHLLGKQPGGSSAQQGIWVPSAKSQTAQESPQYKHRSLNAQHGYQVEENDMRTGAPPADFMSNNIWANNQDQQGYPSTKLRVTNPDVDHFEPGTVKQAVQQRPPINGSNVSQFFIFTPTLLHEVHDCIERFVESLIMPGYVADESCAYEIPTGDIGVLTCLSQDEYKYLPLWAGGYDDGTGGVFNDGDEIPEAPEVEDGGFRGGAMGVIPGVGSSIGEGSVAGSGFDEIMTENGVSTVGKASRIATDGEETVMSLDE